MSQARLENLRSLAFGSISGSYAKIGTPLDHPSRLVHFTNNTDGDLLISIDGTNDHIFIASGSFVLYDVQTNHRRANEASLCFRKGTQFWVKQVSAPSEGSIYISTLYASTDN